MKINEHLDRILRIHFDEKNGSEYWLKTRKNLRFDPLKDINDVGDLDLFGFMSPDDLRRYPIEIFIPKSLLKDKSKLILGSSGGRTGRPKWIAYGNETYDYNLKMLNKLMDKKNVPEGLNFLYVGPTGPHLFGKRVFDLCKQRNGLFFTIDFDPRWARKLEQVERRKYIDHIVKQTLDIIETQDIGVLFTTPSMLTRFAQEEEITNSELRAIGFAGTPMRPDDYKFFTEEAFPDVTFVGYYGNALFGVSIEVDVVDYQIVYQPPEPYAVFEVRDPENPDNLVEYGSRGQLLGRRLSPEFFIPAFLESDEATRFKPAEGFETDSIMNPENMLKDVDYGVY